MRQGLCASHSTTRSTYTQANSETDAPSYACAYTQANSKTDASSYAASYASFTTTFDNVRLHSPSELWTS
jgi:hypothetical protein